MLSLETIVQKSSRALVIGVGGGGDVVGAFATARFLEFCSLGCVLGGLSWEQPLVDPEPGPRSLDEVTDVRPLHLRAWLANGKTRTRTGVRFAESRLAEILGTEVLLVDINGGVAGVVEGLTAAIQELRADLVVGVDVGGDSLATGCEHGLRSPLADAIMLAAFEQLGRAGSQTLWGMFGYGSDGELSATELERALSTLAKAGGLLGGWALTSAVASELQRIVEVVPTEASAIPVRCALGASGKIGIRGGSSSVRLTPLSAITFYLDPGVIYKTLSVPARAVSASSSLDEANEALHGLGLTTELDFERGSALGVGTRRQS